MINENKTRQQGSTLPEVWNIPDDLTGKNVFLTLKDTYDSTVRLVDEANELGGGSVGVLVVAFANASGSITWTPAKADTSALYGDKYYEITYTNDSGENVPYIFGIMTIERVVRLDTDESASPASVFYDQRYGKMFMVEVNANGSKSKFKDIGFDLITADITTVLLGNGVFKITSANDIFTNSLKILITPLDRAIDKYYMSNYLVKDAKNLEIYFIEGKTSARITTRFICEVYEMRW